MRCLTTQESAEKCRVSTWTIYRWIKNGRLPAAKIGKSWLIDPVALDDLVAGKGNATALDDYIWAVVSSAPELTAAQVQVLRDALERRPR